MGILSDLMSRLRGRRASRGRMFSFQGNIPLPAKAEGMLLAAVATRGQNDQKPIQLVQEGAIAATRIAIWNAVNISNSATVPTDKDTFVDDAEGIEFNTRLNAENFTRVAIEKGGLLDKNLNLFRDALT